MLLTKAKLIPLDIVYYSSQNHFVAKLMNVMYNTEPKIPKDLNTYYIHYI